MGEKHFFTKKSKIEAEASSTPANEIIFDKMKDIKNQISSHVDMVEKIVETIAYNTIKTKDGSILYSGRISIQVKINSGSYKASFTDINIFDIDAYMGFLHSEREKRTNEIKRLEQQFEEL